ncbi:hypothetical protein Bca4012_001939 [Brassica carinata]
MLACLGGYLIAADIRIGSERDDGNPFSDSHFIYSQLPPAWHVAQSIPYKSWLPDIVAAGDPVLLPKEIRSERIQKIIDDMVKIIVLEDETSAQNRRPFDLMAMVNPELKATRQTLILSETQKPCGQDGEGTTREGSKEVQTVVSATRLTLTLSFPVIMSCTRRLAYADDMAKLPLKQASRLLYRYNLPNESKRPRTLSRLSDTSVWERRKTKGKVAIQKMVVDLMELYLHRLRQKRFPYPKNPTMAAQFPYNATPDQKQAFLDVDKDLTERETPMDRFICGDVGFVCLASPNQSRSFKSVSEKEAYLEMIKHGHLNIIVGTHSLLGSRVVYNLGLLVVDEEHRFGVKQKERIASFKTSVDVLTLSATPIPRTFYLALNGFRDASLISTPPLERIPIKTHLSSFLKEKVIKAIKNELNRGGQVFYALPRIKGLEEVMDFLEEAFPDIDIAMAHGKPYSKQLEETKERFAQGKIKILICTNIVESGLDIQNANYHNHPGCSTIWVRSVVPVAWKVGRADKEAHAYLFYPEKSPISDQALERLSALEECCQLGQGDVGNVGIDLFFEMLFESLSKVEELRIFSAPYNLVKIDIKINPRLPSKQLRKICGVSCNSQRTYVTNMGKNLTQWISF